MHISLQQSSFRTTLWCSEVQNNHLEELLNVKSRYSQLHSEKHEVRYTGGHIQMNAWGQSRSNPEVEVTSYKLLSLSSYFIYLYFLSIFQSELFYFYLSMV